MLSHHSPLADTCVLRRQTHPASPTGSGGSEPAVQSSVSETLVASSRLILSKPRKLAYGGMAYGRSPQRCAAALRVAVQGLEPGIRCIEVTPVSSLFVLVDHCGRVEYAKIRSKEDMKSSRTHLQACNRATVITGPLLIDAPIAEHGVPVYFEVGSC